MKFLIKFTKHGNMVYISHLDIMRLFQRTLKRTDIKLKYSEGYSPHPKMSIVQPLSLGYTSVGEYFEFETQNDFDTEDILARMNGAMPEGIEILSCAILTETKKAVGALITKGEYLIGADEASSEDEIKALCEAVDELRAKEHIIIEKVQKKSGKVKEIDIREKIERIEVEKAEADKAVIRVMVDTGSYSNLNPELIIVKLKEYMKNHGSSLNFHVQREEMFADSATGGAIPLYLLK